MPRDEADGPLAPHLRAIGKDECIYDDSDVYAVLQAAARIEELEAACSDLTTRNLALEAGIAAHRNYSEHYRSILWDGEVVRDLPHNEALWSLLDGNT